MELEVELEGLEVYPKYSISWSTYVQAFTHFFFFFMGAKGPTILHLFFFLFSCCRPPSMWGWCVSNRTALSVSVGPTWCLHLPRTVSNILPWLVMAHPHPVLLTYVEICCMRQYTYPKVYPIGFTCLQWTWPACMVWSVWLYLLSRPFLYWNRTGIILTSCITI